MELRQLKQAVMLAKTLNFHRAAEQLHMAQPPLSASIKKLEEELGVLLFERLPSGLKPTTSGEIVLRHARRTLFFADEIHRAAHGCKTGSLGRVRVGFVGSASSTLMPKIIRNYRESFPEIDLRIEEGTTADLMRRLEEHSLDVALVRFPVQEPCAASITLLQIERLLLAVSSDSPLAGAAELSMKALVDQPFIAYSRTLAPNMYQLTTQAFQLGGLEPHIVQEAVQVHTMLGLVESGMGVALVPENAGRRTGSDVRLIPLRGVTDRLRVGTAMAALPQATTRAVELFIEHVKRTVGHADEAQ